MIIYQSILNSIKINENENNESVVSILLINHRFDNWDDDAKDVFVHSSAVKNAGLSGLAEGEAITFEVEEGTKGPAAVNLQKG